MIKIVAEQCRLSVPVVIWPADTLPTEQTAYLGIGGLVILGAVVLLVAEFL